VEWFPYPPPPLMPVLDAARIWKGDEVHAIEIAREKLRRRYPQFRLHVCSVMLPAETSLPAFGFWLLNVCPLYVDETSEERMWVVLLLINAATGRVAVIPGYSAERWLTSVECVKALEAMAPAWKSGKPGTAVIRFCETATRLLDQVWKQRAARKSRRSR
jgi:hypothetical protein